MNTMIRLLAVLLLMTGLARVAHAVTGVHPSGVNVNAGGVTTVFLTFQSLNANEVPQESYWCGDVIATGVSSFDPCVPGTIFGRLPARHDFSRASGTGAMRNFTDIMTIPASVARRAYQQAESGAQSDFFYVRRFSDGINSTYVTVTCRMAGGGARVPLSLTEVTVAFDTAEGARPVYFFDRDDALPPFAADIRYNGAGQLRGRWEIVQPGDIEPTVQDLLTEATLPIELRGTQRTFALIERFNVFLPPTGRFRLPGPDPAKIKPGADGAYKILLRIEASPDKEGDSNTLDGIVTSGGVAGFPLPVLQFYVGSAEAIAAAQAPVSAATILLLTPTAGDELARDRAPFFAWLKAPEVAMYRLEIRAADGSERLSAIVTDADYTAPPWLFSGGETAYWRVIAYDSVGRQLGASRWERISVASVELETD